MDSEEQISKLRELIESKYAAALMETVGKGQKSLVIDFADLASSDPMIAEELLSKPEDIIKAAELAMQEFDMADNALIRARFKNLPSTQKIPIRNIRSDDIGKFVMIEGLVRQKSDVRPQVITARFECPSCGNVISVLQLESAFKEPTRCGCGRKGRFRLVSKELVDAQGIVLEETPESLEGGEQPKRINIFLKEDLVSPMSEKRTNPGSKIRIIGFVKEIPIVQKGTKLTRFDLLVEANYVESIEEDFYEIKISKEDEAKILELSRDEKVYDKLTASIAPSIYGYQKVKRSLLLQLMGGVQKKRSDGIVSRGDIHILLVGDPGAGKSQMLKRMSMIAPKGRYVSGKGISGAGITASVVKDEFLGGWSLEAGALVLANNGLVAIDEMDKMSHEDRGAMHEAMEQQTVSISKANIQATLLAKTTVLAAANPKFGRFDPYGIIAEQIDLPPTLINRFDLIFPIKDMPSTERDEKLASHILNLHQAPETEMQEIPTAFLKKYIAYARQKVHPVLTDSALNEIKDFYVSMRNKGGSDERTERAIPISARQLEALVRLSEASARVRLSDKVLKKDAKMAIELVTYCLLQVGLDRETGKIDIDRIATGIGASQRDRIFQIKEILSTLEGKIGKTIPIDDVLKAATEKGITESEAEEIIEKLKRSGDVYEPRFGFVSKI
jgi:replicative DNA helicase Mcm